MRFTVRGVVTSGYGRGKEFIKLEGYARQFEERLEYKPYPGTLNLELDDPVRDRLDWADAVRIEGWESGADSFGAVYCYLASPVDGNGSIPLHVIVPDRTDHDKSTIELVSPVNLRDRFELSDGATFGIHVESADRGTRSGER
ncbi:DUF120 domain-containing protein [Halegenticoccus tardaugens]|uniref:DUF120 domain-containing protein n=1 Tax=Halegenticoccus tardaugens TaxID=2071624 RepID=UPI00100C05A1|nr:DUF120 domain-containing protein [Halegenticoccus tardaugens]